ncbi:unnamed protein product [Moneuplotes crassus]|uniref:Uncharacterized protein n=1 Tax=Euplotes crassus TaxID=5936 RepID=A0AAD1Y2D5_EUPCR|nr:unnamed protein product [Moneuplotes crassus]
MTGKAFFEYFRENSEERKEFKAPDKKISDPKTAEHLQNNLSYMRVQFFKKIDYEDDHFSLEDLVIGTKAYCMQSRKDMAKEFSLTSRKQICISFGIGSFIFTRRINFSIGIFTITAYTVCPEILEAIYKFR